MRKRTAVLTEKISLLNDERLQIRTSLLTLDAHIEAAGDDANARILDDRQRLANRLAAKQEHIAQVQLELTNAQELDDATRQTVPFPADRENEPYAANFSFSDHAKQNRLDLTSPDFRAFFDKLFNFGEGHEFTHETYKRALVTLLPGKFHTEYRDMISHGLTLQQVCDSFVLQYCKPIHPQRALLEANNFKRLPQETLQAAMTRYSGLLRKAELLLPPNQREGVMDERRISMLIKIANPQTSREIRIQQRQAYATGYYISYDDLLTMAEESEFIHDDGEDAVAAFGKLTLNQTTVEVDEAMASSARRTAADRFSPYERRQRERARSEDRVKSDRAVSFDAHRDLHSRDAHATSRPSTPHPSAMPLPAMLSQEKPLASSREDMSRDRPVYRTPSGTRYQRMSRPTTPTYRTMSENAPMSRDDRRPDSGNFRPRSRSANRGYDRPYSSSGRDNSRARDLDQDHRQVRTYTYQADNRSRRDQYVKGDSRSRSRSEHRAGNRNFRSSSRDARGGNRGYRSSSRDYGCSKCGGKISDTQLRSMTVRDDSHSARDCKLYAYYNPLGCTICLELGISAKHFEKQCFRKGN